MEKEQEIKWKLPKKRQPIWRVFKFIFRPFFYVKKVEFLGGCNGNTKGIANLCVGMKVNDVIGRLQGITCGFKSTSCPDQLSCALTEYLNNK